MRILIKSLLFLLLSSSLLWAQTFPPPKIEEADGGPSFVYRKLVVPNDSLTKDGTVATLSVVSANDWTSHDNYPDPCDTDEYVTAIGDTLTCSPSNSVSPWDEDATTIFQNDLSKDVAVGAATSPDNAKLGITGESDQVQFLIRGFLAQASNLMEAQKSDGTKVFQLGLTGSLSLGDGTAGGAISMLELAAAPADVAGRGQYWVRNDVPNVPMFTDDTGTDYNLLDAGTVDHGATTGLGDDDHTQYALLAGRAGGQTLIGGTAAGNDLTFQTTSNATKGTYILSELVSCDTIDTDASGNLSCGTDSGLGSETNNLETITTGIASGEIPIGTAADDVTYVTPSGDVTINTSGVTAIGSDKILESMLKAVDAAADEECLTKEDTTGDFEWQACGLSAETNDLESVTTGIASGEIVIGTASNDSTYVTPSGDVTINTSGVTAIGSDKITEAMLKSVNAATDEYCLTKEDTTGDFEWQTCGSGTGANFNWILRPEQAMLTGGSDSMLVDPPGMTFKGLYDADSTNCASWYTILSPYSGTLKATILYSMVSATSGTIDMTLSIACITADSDSQDVDTKTYGTADEYTETVPGTAGYLGIITDSSLNGNSCSEGDLIIAKLCRDGSDGTNDTATGKVEIREARIYGE